MKVLKVKDVMTSEPFMVRPTQTVKEAAKLMKDIDCGVLPVGEPEKAVGMVTDRDMAMRVIAEGRDPGKTAVQDIMTSKVYTCDEDDSLEQAAEKMHRHSVRRLVVTRGKKVIGIINFTSLIRNKGDRQQSERVLVALEGKLDHRKPVSGKMATAGAGCESCE